MLTLYLKFRNLPVVLLGIIILLFKSCGTGEGINRHDLITRNNILVNGFDDLNSLTVGNGNFAFTADITGLQTFPVDYLTGIPLGTFSNSIWHSFPNDENYKMAEVIKYFNVGGRQVPYYHDYGREKDTRRARASGYLRSNPHRMNMGLLGFRIIDDDGREISLADITNPRQELDLWKGEITSYFEIEGHPVVVTTVAHPGKEMISVFVQSELLLNEQVRINLVLPAADPGWKNLDLPGKDDLHQSSIVEKSDTYCIIDHRQDSTAYRIRLDFDEADLVSDHAHQYEIIPSTGSVSFNIRCNFNYHPRKDGQSPSFEEVQKLAEEDWKEFWMTGGAVDFSGCTDPRAAELERRVVLSRYLTRVNCGGSFPPQETGLTYNSWFGKFHLEMHWWHGVHFALWQKPEILEDQMQHYQNIIEPSRSLARIQGYTGARWPKMTGPDGITSPSTVGNYLIWQQPHYIYFAELLFQSSEDPMAVLDKYSDLVFETAEFMASYPVFDSLQDRYVLGPALISAQETFPAESTINPAFELTYWHWGLKTAIEWKKRLDRQVPESWSNVLEKLPELAVMDSLYLFAENAMDSYTNPRYLSDHPMILGCQGMLPQTGMVDPGIMENTYQKVKTLWNWASTWGWDYPMIAMCAADLGKAEEAVEFLLYDTQKNTYLPNGHNYQDARLTIYLPGNGGLLTAVARMCTKDQFPKDGTWEVRWEGLKDF